jgi:hypothetical protein
VDCHGVWTGGLDAAGMIMGLALMFLWVVHIQLRPDNSRGKVQGLFASQLRLCPGLGPLNNVITENSEKNISINAFACRTMRNSLIDFHEFRFGIPHRLN